MIALPERGRIGIFNRSYYEECLVVRVHPEILAKQKIPPQLVTKNIWRERFEDISAMERYLARNGTVILKFFLNVSKEEQRERFLERLEEPAKNWKFSLADIAERKLWAKYQAAYQDLIRHTSSRAAPWHVVPADHKWFARVVIGSAIVSALDRLDLHFPKVDKADRSEFKQVREALLAEEKAREGDEEVGWAEAQLRRAHHSASSGWSDRASLRGFPENHLPAFSRVHVFANLLDTFACDHKDEAVVVFIRPPSRKRRPHPLFNDHRFAIGMDGAKRDIDPGEQAVHLGGDKARDLVRADHVIGMRKRHRRRIAGRRDPFGVRL